MPRLEIPVRVFDPATPFETHLVDRTCIDTWHSETLLTRNIHQWISQVKELGTGQVPISGGVSMNATRVVIGIDIGNIRLRSIPALLVDQGRYDLVLGQKILEKSLALGGREGNVVVTSAAQDDPRSLSLELRPLEEPPSLLRLNTFLQAVRTLYVLLVLTEGELPSDPSAVEAGQELEDLLPVTDTLQVTWIQADPLSVTMRSGRTAQLAALARAFRTSAVAELEREAGRQRDRQARTELLTARRAQTVVMIAREEELYDNKREAAFDAWCEELPARLVFLKEALEDLGGRDVAEALELRRERALEDLRRARILPICRRLPAEE